MNQEHRRLRSYVDSQSALKYAQRRVGKVVRSAYGHVIKHVRIGPNLVIFAPPYARGGNWLYEWAYAYEDGMFNHRTVRVRYIDGMDVWISEFPRLSVLTVHKKDIKLRDQRAPGFYQDIRNRSQLNSFIQDVLLSSEKFSCRVSKYCNEIATDDLVINVRRGDYYSSDVIRRNFGIDTVAYVKTSVELAYTKGSYRKIFVVSDDLEWCSRNLGFLRDYTEVDFTKHGTDIFDDLAFLAAASHLILTNTTFGYWGAYLAEAQRPVTVYAPNMHERATAHREDIMQHLSTWHVVSPLHAGSWLIDDAQ